MKITRKNNRVSSFSNRRNDDWWLMIDDWWLMIDDDDIINYLWLGLLYWLLLLPRMNESDTTTTISTLLLISSSSCHSCFVITSHVPVQLLSHQLQYSTSNRTKNAPLWTEIRFFVIVLFWLAVLCCVDRQTIFFFLLPFLLSVPPTHRE